MFCGVLLGFAFLAKMLQAFLVVPGFAIAYLWAGAPRGLLRRVWQTVVMGAGIIVGAGWWLLIAQLTPAADRPYFGGSTDNNILQLAIGYNGLGRITGDETGSIGGGGPGGGSAFGGATGLLRLFHTEFGGQISWLLPAALICLAAMAWVSRRAARTDRIRAAALLWGGWVIVTGLVFSYMSGIIHPYYMVALAPGIGALVGIGAMALVGEAARLGRAGGGGRGGAGHGGVVVRAAGPDAGLAALAALGGAARGRAGRGRGARRSVAGPADVLPAAGAAPARAGHGRGAGRAGRVRAGHGEHRAHRLDPERGTSYSRVRRRRPGGFGGVRPGRTGGTGFAGARPAGHGLGRDRRHGHDRRHRREARLRRDRR